ncbi:2-oxo acid dehydrogenase subunit E2 [Brevibacillus humidisoli]|uniref:dihydrolipoamide acetyltransferase family protein n=1 Tax=Brevibacillus humidisoli TaxID=2895522 RepID=UPI001E552311|nr:dihydrolipoamide acetyltransferase family protein [Brevibacillus humidisoli]UFJ39630.1 2-oxo acid dehydrogenase subunit E2 [Brevibacillus humidisoli]
MAAEVIMPKLGMSMKEGTVTAWKKQVGDQVSKGDGVVEISSEKIEMEVEAPADGVLLHIAVAEGGTVPYGTVLGYIGQPGEKIEKTEQASDSGKAGQAAGESGSAGEKTAEAATGQEQSASAPAAKKASVGGLKISPVARKMAEEAGLPLDSVVGTGPQGRITKEDVEKALAAREQSTETAPADTASVAAQESVEITPVAGMRKVIATRMHESLQQSAQLTITMKADVTELLQLQKQLTAEVQKRYEKKLTVTDFIARAVVLSLGSHKQINSAYLDDRIETYGHIHLGIAVALEKGLMVPVIRHAEQLSLIQLSNAIKLVGERARSNQLSSVELKGSTFTITNLGAYGVEFFTPVLNPPEAGILGVGAIEDAAVYRGGEWQQRSLLPLSLTFDHRVLDGAPAAQFLGTIKRYLEEPYSLLL